MTRPGPGGAVCHKIRCSSWGTWMAPPLVALSFGAVWVAAGMAASAAENFKQVAIYLEQNVEDGDIEVKFEIVGGRTGLAALQVAAPDGRTVIDVKAPDSKLGLRHFAIETPEPANNGSVQTDYPAGRYRFTARTVSGETLSGEAVLNHQLPPPASGVRPRAGETGVPPVGLKIRWVPVAAVSGYILTVEQQETGREIRAVLPPSATSFSVPAGFMEFGAAYKLSIGTISPDGNRSFTESRFTTSARR